MKGPVNIYMIAKEAEVSPATVSRVIRNSTYVSPEKKEKVEAIIHKYDYKPNAMAQGLRASKTNVIGIMPAQIDSMFYSKLTAECERIAHNMGYMLMILSSMSNYELEKKQLSKLFEQRVDAVIVLGGNVDRVAADEEYVELINKISDFLPVIATGRPRGTDCYKVCMDEGHAMELAMNYLLELGHTKIAVMGGSKRVKSTLDKRLKYRSMLRRRGIAFRKDYLVETNDYNYESGYESMKQLLKNDPPTAVIAINDFFGDGVMKAVIESGKKIPADLSVIAFDNTYFSRVVSPALTSVACDYENFARLLVETTIKVLEGKEVKKDQTVDVSLIKRSSCKNL